MIHKAVVLMANKDASIVTYPGNRSLDFPTSLVSAELSTILRRFANASASVRADQIPALFHETPAVDRCHSHDQQSRASPLLPAEVRSPTLLQPKLLPTATRWRWYMPQELPCHQPPPSTLYPFHVWFFRPRYPFFCGSKAPVNKHFLPI